METAAPQFCPRKGSIYLLPAPVPRSSPHRYGSVLFPIRRQTYISYRNHRKKPFWNTELSTAASDSLPVPEASSSEMLPAPLPVCQADPGVHCNKPERLPFLPFLRCWLLLRKRLSLFLQNCIPQSPFGTLYKTTRIRKDNSPFP